ncbi:SDR family NAD(P)-dependent oxidoreductase [Marinicaulis aureus]|uniref:SDR family NAD(P)-dependent oxidoreductase n=1 Tax=Hyphococcus aureus TaxID=2666033 RepID=A0ABW1L122_9PROT
MNWQGKTAFITGGVSGIGFGIARAFSNAGMRLALSYRNEEYKAAAAIWFADQEREAPLFLKLDVTDRKRFAEVAEEVEAHFGKVHVLVNNAGVSVFGPTDEATYDDFDWIMGVNFGGNVNGIVSFIPKIKAHGEGGHIVNVASMAAYISGPQAGIYTASKFAVRGMTECLRYNLAPYNIGVSLVCPGLTKTNAWDSALRRPDNFKDSGLGKVDKAELEKFGGAFDLGMDPLEVGEKILKGMTENRGLILTHPEHGPDIQEIYETTMAALPDEPAPEGRLEIERLRREGNKAAASGRKISLDDLT